jgi:hypothetical protein
MRVGFDSTAESVAGKSPKMAQNATAVNFDMMGLAEQKAG